MLLVLAITFSILVVTVSYLKKISQRQRKSSFSNEELDKYYALPSNSPPQAVYKQLVNAASSFLATSEELERQTAFVEPLYKDRLVSDEYYDDLVYNGKELELEKMLIESECESIKKGTKEQLFQEASRSKSGRPRKTCKIPEDQFFVHKREVLESELKKKLIK